MKTKSLLRHTALVLLPIISAACTTLDPYTREEKVSKATWGTVIGSASGAAVGALSGDNGRERRKRALIGAGALITEGKEIPPGALAMGAPGKVVRQLDAEAQAGMLATAAHYRERMRRFRKEMKIVQ